MITCLTATQGRFSCLRVALACFLIQDAPERELIILNNHPTPLQWPPNLDNGESEPGLATLKAMQLARMVHVFNEPQYPTLGDCRNRLIELAKGDFVRTWDDDDLYLPWTLSQGLENIGDAPAFKPMRSWSARSFTLYELTDNVFEAAMLVRFQTAKRYGFKAKSGGDEHSPLLEGIEKDGGCRKIEMNWRASYAYNWDTSLGRISGTLGSGLSIEERTRLWASKNADTGEGGILTPDFVGMAQQYAALCKSAWRSLPLGEARELSRVLTPYIY